MATQSIVPERSPSISAWRSSSERSGGFILKRASRLRTSSSVSVEVVRRRLGGDRDARPALARCDRLDRLARREVLDVDRGRPRRRRARRRGRSSSTPRPTGSRRGRAPPRPRPRASRRRRRARGPPRAARARRPASRWYWSARRSTRALRTGRPSSEKPTAPASRSSAISVSSSPVDPAGDRGEEARPAPTASRSARSRSARDVGGGVDGRVGVGHREDAAVAAGRRGAGAGLDVLLVLVARGAQVDVGVEEGGKREQPVGVDDLGVRRPRRCRAAASSAISPSRTTRSWTPSIPARGSEHLGAAQHERRPARRRRQSARRSGPALAHAGSPIGEGSAAPRSSRARRRAGGRPRRAARRGSPSARPARSRPGR